GEHNLSEFGPETTVATLRQAADVVPFLADRRMVIVRGLLGRLAGRGSGSRQRQRTPRKAEASAPDELQVLLEYLPDVPQTTSLAFVEEGRISPEPLARAIPRGRGAIKEYP